MFRQTRVTLDFYQANLIYVGLTAITLTLARKAKDKHSARCASIGPCYESPTNATRTHSTFTSGIAVHRHSRYNNICQCFRQDSHDYRKGETSVVSKRNVTASFNLTTFTTLGRVFKAGSRVKSAAYLVMIILHGRLERLCVGVTVVLFNTSVIHILHRKLAIIVPIGPSRTRS